jgi:threonine dehydratase
MTPQRIIQVSDAIKAHVLNTPLVKSVALSELCHAEVFLKCEHLQYTGSFKLRGATAKMLALTASQRKKGVISASTGNHGQGIAMAAGRLNVPAVIYTPELASPAKLAAIERLGASIRKVAGNCYTAEAIARETASREGRVYISPYNDLEVIAGQGTIGVELTRQEEALDAVFISVGGGGLISGVGSYLKGVNPKINIVGCWPENSRAMYESLNAGKIIEVDERPTLSDGTAGPVEPGSVTFSLCQNVVDQRILVSEGEIRSAMRLLAEHDHWMVEGAAGVALAGLIQTAATYRGRRIAVVLCGRNIALETFLSALSLNGMGNKGESHE